MIYNRKDAPKKMEIYTLTITTECLNEFAHNDIKLYAKKDDVISAYEQAFDIAMERAKTFKNCKIDKEIATDKPYRYYRVYDIDNNYESITIELDTKIVQ